MANRVVYFFITLYFWAGALWGGYFTEMAFLVMNGFLYVGWAVWVVYKRELAFTKASFFLFLFVIGYWVTLGYAVDFEQAVVEAARVSGLIPLTFMVSILSREQLYRLYQIWPWIGALLTIIGIGFEMERNGRLESTIYYANALAILLLINILICIQSYLKENRLLHLVLLTINAVGLLLTFSRSVWVLWLVMVGIAVIGITQLRRFPTLIPITAAHVCSLGIALWLKKDMFFFWQRVSSIQSNTSEFQIRLVYWKDSLKMIRDYWWGGTGGGGWNVLVPLYHSQDYYVKFVHNHYIQVALDIGVFGLTAFVMWLGIPVIAGLVRLIRSRKRQEDLSWSFMILLTITSLLLHAGFDFDLTFPFLAGVLVCLTASLGGQFIKLSLSKIGLAIAMPIALVIAGLWGWLAAGYGYSLEGNHLSKAGHYEEAQASYSRSAEMMPWSSLVLYNSAKGYVLQGNATGDAKYYQLAKEQLQQAHERVPEQMLYTDLLNEINNFRQK